MVRRLRMGRASRLCLGLPGAVLAAAGLGLMVAAAVAGHPLWWEEPVNISEAAAFRDPARVARLLREGVDPRVGRLVRHGVLAPGRVLVTPLQAAIASNRAEVVAVLLDGVDALDRATWRDAMCLAGTIGGDEIEPILQRRRPPETELDCAGYVRPW